MRQLKELVEAWRAARGEARGTSLLGEVASATTRIARDSAKRYRLPDGDVDDVAQEVSARFVADLRDAGLIPERPEALVWRMSENRAKDLWRAARRGRNAIDRFTAEATIQPAVQDPEGLWLDRERQIWSQRTVRELLKQAPENYQTVLRRHYLEGVSIETMAEEEFQSQLRLGAGEPSEVDALSLRRKARNRIDQHLKRGRDWLRKRLDERLEQPEEEEP